MVWGVGGGVGRVVAGSGWITRRRRGEGLPGGGGAFMLGGFRGERPAGCVEAVLTGAVLHSLTFNDGHEGGFVLG